MTRLHKSNNLSEVTKKILESGFVLFNGQILKDISGINKRELLGSAIKRLLANKILLRLEKDKYIIKNRTIDSYNLANLIYAPSYISFETALNFYGILSQFPHELSSATPKKTKHKKLIGQHYSYIHLKSELFFGYVKHNGILMANPEKALLDQIYLSLKGLKKINLEEYDFSIIKKGRLKEYYSHYSKLKRSPMMDEIIIKVLKLC